MTKQHIGIGRIVAILGVVICTYFISRVIVMANARATYEESRSKAMRLASLSYYFFEEKGRWPTSINEFASARYGITTNASLLYAPYNATSGFGYVSFKDPPWLPLFTPPRRMTWRFDKKGEVWCEGDLVSEQEKQSRRLQQFNDSMKRH